MQAAAPFGRTTRSSSNGVACVERVGGRLKSVDGVAGLAPVPRDHHTAGTVRVECRERKSGRGEEEGGGEVEVEVEVEVQREGRRSSSWKGSGDRIPFTTPEYLIRGVSLALSTQKRGRAEKKRRRKGAANSFWEIRDPKLKTRPRGFTPQRYLLYTSVPLSEITAV
jgi:hypothetical protein